MKRPETYQELFTMYCDSVTNFVSELEAKYQELDKLKESDRTKAFHTEKMIKRWFYKNGGLPI